MIKPKFNVWVEAGEKVVLSLWRVQLLAAVGETGSISAGAAQMDIPYRVAWQKIHEMEERLDQKLVETHTGGQGGGGAHLTPQAQVYIEKFDRFSQDAQAYLQGRYLEIFGDDIL